MALNENANIKFAEEESQKHLKTVAKGAGLVFAGLVISKILTYLYRLVIARYHGPEDYGMISIGLSLIGVIVILLILGMDSGILRYVPEYNARNDERRVKGAIVTSLKVTLPLSAAAAVLLFLGSPYMAGLFAKDAATQSGLTVIFQAFSFMLPFSACYSLILAAARGFKRMDYYVYTDNVFFSIILLSSTVLFTLMGFGITGLAWSYALTVVTSFLLIFLLFNTRIFNIFGGTKPLSENRVLFGYAIPLFIGGLAMIAIGSLDTLLLGVFRTAVDTGVYNAALPTAKFIIIFGGAFVALFFPIMVEYKAKKMTEQASILYRTTTKWIFLCSLPFTLLLVFFSRSVLNILFGPEYLPAAGALSILSLTFFAQTLSLTSNLILSLERVKYNMWIVIFAAFLNVILNIVLIPSLGILGAAIATSASTILYVSFECFFAWKFSGMNPFDFRQFFKSVLAGLLSLAPILIVYRLSGLSPSIFVLLPFFFTFLAIYTVFLFAFRALDKNDINVLLEIERKSGIRIGFIRKVLKRLAG